MALFKPLRRFGASYYSDVEDFALLHVAALTQDDVKGERLFTFEETLNFNGWLDVFDHLAPDRPWPMEDAEQA